MNTCRTCKFRKLHFIDHNKRNIFRCVSLNIFESLNEEYTELQMAYSYEEGGSFHVGENFGCIHHSEV